MSTGKPPGAGAKRGGQRRRGSRGRALAHDRRLVSPETHWAYDYFDALTSEGTPSRLRFDPVYRAWPIDAVYD